MRLQASPRRAQPGQRLVYRARVRNAGPGEAVLPVLTVRVPRGVRILHVDVAECRPGRTAREVVCATGRDVPVGEGGKVTITGVVRPGAKGPLLATARLSSQVLDGDESDNAARTVTRIGEGADLSVRLSGLRRAGRTVTVDALVGNRGPRTVRDGLIVLQARRARVVSADGARCRSRSHYTGCALAALRPGDRVRIRFVLRGRGDAVDARATVYSARLGDRRLGDNSDRARSR
ncbi:hypothetical protein ACFOWE_06320 [Planomonospora corallina]|uniref:DUF11 domain-containing protein n=1 Tax=Planomonospora corallina TaxID=1806052 RepID=A0ABV8I7M2_9ACTN